MNELSVLRDLGCTTDPGTASARRAARAALDRRISRRRPRLRRPIVVGIAVASAAVVAGGAFALGQYVFVGGAASPAVQREVKMLAGVKETLRSHATATGVLVEQTRAAVVLDTVAGPAYLWVATTRDGGSCQFLELADLTQPDGRPNLQGGCATDARPALDASFPWLRVGQKAVALVYGYAREAAGTIRVNLQSGATRTGAIRDHYFMVEVPAGEAPSSADQVVSVDALAEDGSVVATEVKPGIQD